ncbi:MAG: alpha/beta hydrolase [Ruegeria sp.]
MRRVGRVLGRIVLVLIVAGGLIFWFGPREEVDLNPSFEPRKFGEGVQVYFESIESAFDDIFPGLEKRVVWQDGAKEQRTTYSVLYIQGFSATSEEIRPVPDRVADALGANLVYTRLQGHGRGSEAMTEGTASGWMQDTAEALAAARAAGDKVIVISTSTGSTLASAAALNTELSENVEAMVLVSPNFGVNAAGAWLPGLPWARHWLPVIMGGERDVSSPDPKKNIFWTTRYSWEAIVPLTRLAQEVLALDFAAARVPALFWFSDDDQVVRPDLTHEVAAEWGGDSEVQLVTMGPGDDPASHVIAGDLMSPGQNDIMVSGILEWLKGQGIE